MEEWRILYSESNDPYLNMAIEEAILTAVNEGKSPSTVRFWRNSRSVILGRSQNVDEEVNIKECEKYKVQILRRFTGGGTVYQDLGNLNWTFVISRYSKFYPESFSELYEFSCNAVIEGLKEIGIDAEFRPPNSIWLKNKKVSGLAAYIKRNAVLCHGTLLVYAEIKILSKVLSKPRYEVTNIKDELKECSISMDDIKHAILHGIEKTYKIKVNPGDLNAYESVLSKFLYKERYERKSWNFKGTTS
ncbi:MAG: biotin/lipoate A/B protein ligase family protein [Candidatus Bathyarchaeia archaeon]|nr:lipoate--protein ligase family protein [Candidatus Bathyarchaeota archaeon]